MAKKKVEHVAPYADHQRRTCLLVGRENGGALFIPLDISGGLEVRKMSEQEFDQRYKPLDGYPVEKACQLYLGYSQTIGATEEVLSHLGRVINISDQEYKMATTKKAAAPAAKPKPAPKAAAKPTPKTKEPAAKGEKRESAAAMFCELIMAGKLTDDQIFAKVQEKFGLDEKKRGYVKWYRNNLKKKGENPPEPK